MPFADQYSNFIKIKLVMTSLKFSPYTWFFCFFLSNSIEPTNFIFGINIQQHKIHLMIKVQVTLTKAKSSQVKVKFHIK